MLYHSQRPYPRSPERLWRRSSRSHRRGNGIAQPGADGTPRGHRPALKKARTALSDAPRLVRRRAPRDRADISCFSATDGGERERAVGIRAKSMARPLAGGRAARSKTCEFTPTRCRIVAPAASQPDPGPEPRSGARARKQSRSRGDNSNLACKTNPEQRCHDVHHDAGLSHKQQKKSQSARLPIRPQNRKTSWATAHLTQVIIKASREKRTTPGAPIAIRPRSFLPQNSPAIAVDSRSAHLNPVDFQAWFDVKTLLSIGRELSQGEAVSSPRNAKEPWTGPAVHPSKDGSA